MLSFTRWIAALLVTVVLAARSAPPSVHTARASSVRATDAGAASWHRVVTPAKVAARSARTGWSSDVPLFGSATTRDDRQPRVIDARADVSRLPNQLGSTVGYDATGPPAPLPT
jgi:hypothetical protein